MGRWPAIAWLAASSAMPVWAEMDAHEYATEPTIDSARAREQAEAQIRSDREREARAAQREAADEARRLAEAQAARARRPFAERLLEERCTVCHPADNFLRRRHTWLGWQLVIARMRAFNRAPVGWGEQFVLAAELARARPAEAATAMVEYGAGSLALASPLLLGWSWRRWLRRRRG